MASITAVAFNGALNTNEIYNTLFNVNILFQKLAPQTIKRDPVVGMIEKATGMYGDSGIVQGLDIQGTYEFGMDAEAANLLQVNRNKSHKIERYVINKWRQTDVTNDTYISKRAFKDEGTFSIFNSYLVATLAGAMTAFENGFVKTSMGTYKANSAAPKCNVQVGMTPNDLSLETYILRAGQIRNAILNLRDDMADNQRGYNAWGQYASFNMEDMTIIFNNKYSNEVNSMALPQIFNPTYVNQAAGYRSWTPKWFGEVNTNTTTVAGDYSMVEINSDGSVNFPITDTQLAAGVYRIFPGDPLPAGLTITAGQAYTPDDTIIGIIFDPEYVYYMTGFEESESFRNARSSTTNHYNRKGFSDVQMSNSRPFIVLTETAVTTLSDAEKTLAVELQRANIKNGEK